MRAFTFFDLAFLGATSVVTGDYAEDSFETYSDESDIDGLNDGTNWIFPYSGVAYLRPNDTCNSYNDGDDISGLTGGTEFDSSAYVAWQMPQPLDTLQSYSNGNDLDTLNGGSDWGGAWVSR